MQVVRHNAGFRTVDTVADRDLIPKFDGMKITVRDASGDSNIGSGAAEYQWLAEAGAWAVTWSEIQKTISIAFEEKQVSNATVTTDHTPLQGLVWGFHITELNGTLIGEGVPAVSGKIIDVGADFNGKLAKYFYAYSTTETQVGLVTALLNSGFETIATDSQTTADYVAELLA